MRRVHLHAVEARTVCERGRVSEATDDVANLVIAQLLFLEAEDPKKDISFYINSPGGSVTAGLAIVDTMNHVKPPVSTVCVGMAASIIRLVGRFTV